MFSDNICCDVDESGKDDAQGKNPDSKGQSDWTSELKKSVHTAPIVSGRKSDTEETSKQKKLKQREPAWKRQVQKIKTLALVPTT